MSKEMTVSDVAKKLLKSGAVNGKADIKISSELYAKIAISLVEYMELLAFEEYESSMEMPEIMPFDVLESLVDHFIVSYADRNER